MRTFVAVVHHEAGSAFGISFPDLPGCFAASDDEAGLYEAAQAALSLYAEDAEKLQEARPLETIMADPDVAAELRRGAVLISVPLIVAERKTRVNLMFDQSLVRAIDQSASAVGLSRSEFVSQTMSRRLENEIGAVLIGKVRSRRSVAVSSPTHKQKKK